MNRLLKYIDRVETNYLVALWLIGTILLAAWTALTLLVQHW